MYSHMIIYNQKQGTQLRKEKAKCITTSNHFFQRKGPKHLRQNSKHRELRLIYGWIETDSARHSTRYLGIKKGARI